MGTLFKKTITRHKLNGKTVKAGTVNAVVVRETTRKWYCEFTDACGKRRSKSLSSDKAIARQMLTKLEKEVDRFKAGLTTSFDDHLRQPLLIHLRDYLNNLVNRDNTKDHVKAEETRITRILEGCNFQRIKDCDAPKTQAWVAEQYYGIKTANCDSP